MTSNPGLPSIFYPPNPRHLWGLLLQVPQWGKTTLPFRPYPHLQSAVSPSTGVGCVSHSAFLPPEHLWVFAPDLSCGSQQTPHTPNGLCRFPGSGSTPASSTWLLISLGMHEQVRGICSSSHYTLACLSFLLSRLKFKSGSGKGLANVVQISNSEGAERQFLVLCLKVS